MSPRIQGDGGRLRLTWRDVSDGHGQVWVADFGPFRAEVWWSGRGWPWQVGLATLKHEGEGVAVALAREVRIIDSTAELDAAQAAAESAARDLLCSALAAFADGAPNGFSALRWGSPEPGRELRLEIPDTGDLGRACSLSHDDARRLAIALLSASQAGGGK